MNSQLMTSFSLPLRQLPLVNSNIPVNAAMLANKKAALALLLAIKGAAHAAGR